MPRRGGGKKVRASEAISKVSLAIANQDVRTSFTELKVDSAQEKKDAER